VSADEPTPTPCCGEVVDPDDVLDRGECVACGCDLGRMFDLAAGRVPSR